MLWIVGCASGATISFTPSFQMLQLYLWTAWTPVFAVDLWLGSKQGYTVAVTTAALLAFLIAQGRSVHKRRTAESLLHVINDILDFSTFLWDVSF